MAESLTTRFMEMEKKNEEPEIETQFDSSEFNPDEFGVGAVTGKVFEEIYDEQDEWESFFTTMFFIGLILIPLQLIFADDIKPYDAYLIEKIQYYFINTDIFYLYFFKISVAIIDWVANVKFFMSITVFFYLCFDPGVAFKCSLVAGCGTYIVFILKLITHDSRPFWISSKVVPGLCKLSFGSPSLDVFVGMLYSHYLFFCTKRALMSNDDIINLNRPAIQISKYVSIALMILNAFVGVAYFCLGINFIYQILITFFYGFIIIRIIIIFNKDLDHFSNGSRFIKEISNVSTIMIMFFVLILSCVSCMIYEIVNQDLLIPREWSNNISNNCNNSNESTEISIRLTFMDSAAVFYIMGAAFGVNIVLKFIDNPYYWFITPWWKRLIRGTVGFCLNMYIVKLTNHVQFRSVTSNYLIDSFLYALAGFVLYGCMPLLFCKMGLTDEEYTQKKKEKEKVLLERKKSLPKNRETYKNNFKNTPPQTSFLNNIEKRYEYPFKIEEEDERLSK